jgi:hypothetical protein
MVMLIFQVKLSLYYHGLKNFQYEMLAIRDLFFVNDSVGWACGNGQSGNSRQIMKTIDGGLNWHKQFLNYTTNYSAVTQMQCLNDTLCYAISGWQIFKTTNGGGPMIGLGEQEKDNFKSLSICPNPANDRIYLNGVKENYCIRIYNSLGQIQNLSSSIDEFGLDISSLDEGFYIYLINDKLNSRTKNGKFIKQ